MENEIYDNAYVKKLLLFLAKEFSGSFSSIGFVPNEDSVVFQDNSRKDILLRIARIFSSVKFLNDNEVSMPRKMSVLEAKYDLNLVAAFLSGRHGTIGPLSFPLGCCDKGDVKTIKINKGVVDLEGLKNLFEIVSEVTRKVVKKESAVSVKIDSVTMPTEGNRSVILEA